jgi:hypothetical protein
MSELVSALQFLFEAVKFIVNLSVDTIFVLLFSFSAIAPWRWREIYMIFKETSSYSSSNRYEWRWKYLVSFFMTLIDPISLAGIFFAIFSPIRTKEACQTLLQYPFGDDLDWYWDKRMDGIFFLFCAIADFIAYFMLLITALFPWHWSEIYFTFTTPENYYIYIKNDLFRLSLYLFILTIADLIAIPSIIIACLSPFRWKAVFLVITEYCRCTYPPRYDLTEKRFGASFLPFYVVFDFITMFFLLPIVISPLGHQYTLYSIWSSSFHCNDYKEYQQFFLNQIIIRFGFLAILDTLIFLCLLPFLIIDLGVWLYLPTWLSLLTSEIPKLLTAEVQYSVWDFEEKWLQFDQILRQLMFSTLYLTIFDILTIIPLILAFLSPLRHSELMTTIKTKKEDLTRFEFDFMKRLKIIQLGGLALTDILLYPMLLCLWITQYRYTFIQKQIEHTQGFWGIDILGLICQQFFYLLCDFFFFALPLIILWITRIRWLSIYQLLQQEQILEKNTLKVYWIICRQFFYLCCDIICFPFLLILFITWYRFQYLLPYLQQHQLWENDLIINVAILINFFALVFDSIVIFPMLLIILLFAPYRLSILSLFWEEESSLQQENPMIVHFKEQQEQLQKQERRKPPPTTVTTTTVTTTITTTSSNNLEEALLGDTSTTSTAAATTETVSTNELQRAYARYSIPPYKWRLNVAYHFIHTFIDLPFLLMALIVFFTLWRSIELIHRISKLYQSPNPNNNNNNNNKFSSFSLNELIRLCRRVIFDQFILLFIDLLHLIPFALIVGTVYKLPQLVAEIIALVKEEFVTGSSHFTVKSCKMHWKRGQDPSILLELIKTRDNTSLAITTTSAESWNYEQANNFRMQIVENEIWETCSLK